MKVGGLVFEEIAQTFMDFSILNKMIVIQDHDQIVRELGDVIDQTNRHGLGAAQLGCTDDLARFCPDFLVDGLNGGDQVRPEPDRIIVALVKRKPRNWKISVGKPAYHEGGFPKSRWSRYQGQLAGQTFVQAIIKVWPRDKIRA